MNLSGGMKEFKKRSIKKKCFKSLHNFKVSLTFQYKSLKYGFKLKYEHSFSLNN